MGQPDWDQWLNGVWGASSDCSVAIATLFGISGLIFGSNPSYTVQDFFQFYPKWAGPALQFTNVQTTQGQANMSVNSTKNLAVGNSVFDPTGSIPNGTFIQSIDQDGTTLTLTKFASASGAITLTVYNKPVIPVVVLTTFIALATASLMQGRWVDAWPFAMALFVAHYATLYARSDGNPNSTMGQIASQGLATGIQVAKAAGDVSVNYQAIEGIAEWGQWNLTSYGQQLATMAKVIGSGTVLVW